MCAASCSGVCLTMALMGCGPEGAHEKLKLATKHNCRVTVANPTCGTERCGNKTKASGQTLLAQACLPALFLPQACAQQEDQAHVEKVEVVSPKQKLKMEWQMSCHDDGAWPLPNPLTVLLAPPPFYYSLLQAQTKTSSAASTTGATHPHNKKYH